MLCARLMASTVKYITKTLASKSNEMQTLVTIGKFIFTEGQEKSKQQCCILGFDLVEDGFPSYEVGKFQKQLFPQGLTS